MKIEEEEVRADEHDTGRNDRSDRCNVASTLKFFHISLKRYTVTGRDLIQSFAMNDSLGKCLRGERFV